MRLILIRHGDAENAAVSDAARALTEKGRQQAERVGKFLRASGVVPTHFLCSPYRRAVETAQGVAAHLGGEITADRRLACGARPATLQDIWRELDAPRDVVIVGHNPDCEELTHYLTGAQTTFGKGTLVVIDLPDCRERAGELLALVPAEMQGKV
ncbi:hypothetical protein AGMMS49959_18880 [Planctomycetales bacterium]|nr:hypothetical protein AGMMS49959_18880 [Planctomycetales bacterium]